MRTLPRKITRNFYKDQADGFNKLESLWKELLNSPEISLPVEYHLLYQILRGKDFTKGFAEVTNEAKITHQGHSKKHAIQLAMIDLHSLVRYNITDAVDLFGTVVNEAGIRLAFETVEFLYIYPDRNEPYSFVMESYINVA